MKKNLWIRGLSCLLLAIALPLSAGCEHKRNVPADGTTCETTGDGNFEITETCHIVRPYEKNEEETKAVTLLNRGIKSAYNVQVTLVDDFVRRGEEVKPHEYEILVGETNRKESAEIAESVGYMDWKYGVVSGNVIVICGGSPEATLEAVRHFLKNVVGYEEDESGQVLDPGKPAKLETGLSGEYSHDYPVKKITLGKHDISEYTLVVAEKDVSGADILSDAFEKMNGHPLKVRTFGEFAGGPAIYFGMKDKSGGHLNVEPFGNSRYYLLERGEDIVIDFKSARGGGSVAGANKFVEKYIPKTYGDEVVIKLGKESVTGLAMNEKGSSGFEFQKIEESRKVADGITYEKALYKDRTDKPVRVYTICVEKGAGVFHTGTKLDEEKIGVVRDVRSQMKSAAENGRKVAAGVNADFFDIGKTNVPRGLCVKNGKMLHPADGNPWFGMTKDGQPVIQSGAGYKKYKDRLETAVGGRFILIMKDRGMNNTGTAFCDTRHPRTAVGIRPNGDVVIICVDGRQEEYSNGATLVDLSMLFADRGCCDALNLDGGGSTTMLIRNPNGEFALKNRPSDNGYLRYVADSLLVLLP